MTVAEVLAEVEKDRVFYEESGGGATFSGGEPLMQPDFLYSLLSRCRERGIGTAVDTSGYAPWSVLARTAEVADIFLYDVKHMDGESHRRLTGVSNDLILANLRRLVRIHSDIRLRVPVIPSVNDDLKNLRQIGELAAELQVTRVHLLPYHRIGTSKYTDLNEKYVLSDVESPSTERMQQLALELERPGLTVSIGG
jgi:pyruvate formate lyase activating enzyme